MTCDGCSFMWLPYFFLWLAGIMLCVMFIDVFITRGK